MYRIILFLGLIALAAGGAVLRCAATDVETMAANLRALLGFVADLIGEDPWARRW